MDQITARKSTGLQVIAEFENQRMCCKIDFTKEQSAFKNMFNLIGKFSLKYGKMECDFKASTSSEASQKGLSNTGIEASYILILISYLFLFLCIYNYKFSFRL